MNYILLVIIGFILFVIGIIMCFSHLDDFEQTKEKYHILWIILGFIVGIAGMFMTMYYVEFW